MKKIFWLFPIFICLCLSVFYRYTFDKQETEFMNYQKQVVMDKIHIVTTSITDMLIRDNDWQKEKKFYRGYLKDTIESIDAEPTQHAILLDEKGKLITDRKSPKSEWIYEPFNFPEIMKEISNSDEGFRFVYFDKNFKITTNKNNKKILYCWKWIPSINDNPSYLMFVVLSPSKLSYTNNIFVYGAIINILFALIISLYLIYILNKRDIKKKQLCKRKKK